MRTTAADGSERGRRPFGPTTDMLLDVFCLILNAGNPAGRPQLAEVETSPGRSSGLSSSWLGGSAEG